MIRQEAILQSPLRMLDRAIRGGLGGGRLGLILAPPGVGKSACLVQLGLDALLRERPVLHVALGQSVEHVSARYDGLLASLAGRVHLADRVAVGVLVANRRLIWSSSEAAFGAPSLEAALAAFQLNLGAAPHTILVDGLACAAPAFAATLAAVKASAAGVGAALWLTARTARGAGPPAGLPLPEGCAAHVDVALHLEPQGEHAWLWLLEERGRAPATRLPLVLEGGELRLSRGDEAAGEPERYPGAVTLLASGSAGAEEAFGACAEEWGLAEVNYSFQGRRQLARRRGLVELSEDELRAGEVRPAYLQAHMHRAYAGSDDLRRVLQTIWHQVSTAGEVFAVGALNPDDTAAGGTGWAVELARHWGKPVHLFDQERGRWLRWSGQGWIAEEPPVIRSERFAGAGTRSLTAQGRAAIRALFERSFGAP